MKPIEVMSLQKRNWLFRLTWPITHYFVTNLTVMFGLIFFGILNRVTVIGRENVPKEANTLLLSNHQSMIDSFVVGTFAFFPHSLLRPMILPWNPAAEENFYRTHLHGWFADNWKCIPIKKGRKDVGAIYKMAQALKSGPMTLFPEGTRSRDGSIGKPRGGAGLLILETQPTVIPVCIDGMERVLPIGKIFPRLMKHIYIYYGKPVDLTEFYDREKNKETAKEVMKHIWERLRIMRTELLEMQGRGAPMYSKMAVKSDEINQKV